MKPRRPRPAVARCRFCNEARCLARGGTCWRCPSCERLRPPCDGADDEGFALCDDCWAEAQGRPCAPAEIRRQVVAERHGQLVLSLRPLHTRDSSTRRLRWLLADAEVPASMVGPQPDAHERTVQ